jgi:hypothetical protein
MNPFFGGAIGWSLLVSRGGGGGGLVSLSLVTIASFVVFIVVGSEALFLAIALLCSLSVFAVNFVNVEEIIRVVALLFSLWCH